MAKTTPTQATQLDVLDFEIKKDLISQAIYVYQANTHRGVSKVKSRGEVSITTKKMFKQKGTGNARHGSAAAPQFVGGGVVFGPVGHKSVPKKLNTKMKILALAGILTLYRKQGLLSVLDTADIKDNKTKSAVSALGKLEQNTVVVIAAEQDTFLKSISNLPITVRHSRRLNAYHIAQARRVIFTSSAFDLLTQRLSVISKQA